MSTLGLKVQNSPQVSQVISTPQNKSKNLDANFWDNVSEGVAKNEAKSDEICQILIAQNLFLLLISAASNAVVDFAQIAKLVKA